MNVSIYLFFIYTENLKCDRTTLGLSLLGYKGFKWKNNFDIWGPTPPEKFTCQRKLYSQINYPYFKNKTLIFLISESKHDWEFWMSSWLYFKAAIN